MEVVFTCGVCYVSVSDRLERLHSGDHVFCLSTVAAVDAGEHDQEEERGWKERQ